MPRSALERFRCRLSLVAYLRHAFGASDVWNPKSVKEFYRRLHDLDGRNTKGQSYVAAAIAGRLKGITETDLERYDSNVQHHTNKLNRHRDEPITLKYFQVLAALMTEHYLFRLATNADGFLKDLNTFVAEQNEKRTYIEFPSFEADDLNKLAFWMATGSGKTLLMHINYYQYQHYVNEWGLPAPDNVLLVTTKEGMSHQHIQEMDKSGILAARFDATTPNTLFNSNPWAVRVIEITKLTDEKTGEGKSVEVGSLEGSNLAFVDEGHKGTSDQANAWRDRRAALAENGFTFEYSATFGQAIANANTEIEEEYGKAILFDYSYPRFHKDGYGKDYNILNLESGELDADLIDPYLLANLLTFYEQVRCYALHRDMFYGEYNVEPPLLAFVGHTVMAGKNWSELGTTDHRSLSDVEALVLFMHRVLRNEGDWVPETIETILSGGTDPWRDLFADRFRTLRGSSLGGDEIYSDMLARIFHAEHSTDLHLVRLESVDGEIGLRAGSADPLFGLINIGDSDHFLRQARERTPEISREERQVRGSLFRDINRQDSRINILVGAKKFTEGWDSWRVSTMGLMNFGAGEGPEIIQLFGRGVRLLGKDRSLKRSRELEGPPPDDLPVLETLNIFGVRATYMEDFREYLTKEGIDTEQWTEIQVPTRLQRHFKGHGLVVVRPKVAGAFKEAQTLVLVLNDGCNPEVDLTSEITQLASEEIEDEELRTLSGTQKPQELSSVALSLLDWNWLYREVQRFVEERDYRNLVLDLGVLRDVLQEGRYSLFCPSEWMQIQRFAQVKRLERIALMILRKYVERYYSLARRLWEDEQLEYQLLDENDENLIEAYEAQVKCSAEALLEVLGRLAEDPELHEEVFEIAGNEPCVRFRRHLYLPLLVARDRDEVKYAPVGLNEGEHKFVKDLRDFAASARGKEWLSDWELFLLRNLSRGHGVGFVVGEQRAERYFPDFILWLKKEGWQDIVFIDPHGLRHAGDFKQDPKVRFHDKVKDYEERLNRRANRSDIGLHSYIVSQTSFDELSKINEIGSIEECNRLYGVYFREQPGMVEQILEDVMTR